MKYIEFSKVDRKATVKESLQNDENCVTNGKYIEIKEYAFEILNKVLRNGKPSLENKEKSTEVICDIKPLWQWMPDRFLTHEVET